MFDGPVVETCNLRGNTMMRFLERAADKEAVCPLCSAANGVEFSRIPRWVYLTVSIPLIGMLFWTNGRLLWRVLILMTTIGFLAVPTFGRCSVCKGALQKKVLGSGWVHR